MSQTRSPQPRVVPRPLVRAAKLIVRAELAIVTAILLAIMSVLAGLNVPADKIPAVTLVRQYPLAALIISGVVTLVSLGAVIITLNTRPDEPRDDDGGEILRGQAQRVGLSLLASTLSTVALFALLGMVLFRAPWCPTALCPAPQLVTRGIHDGNLEIYFTAFQSSVYEISGDPAQYTLDNLPRQIGALQTDQAFPPYRVVIGAHSLRQSGYSLIIEEVDLVVDAVPPSPQPLNVWNAQDARTYNTNPYRVSYAGQEAGAILPASYVPTGHVQLAPGEADELDIQVISPLAADLQYHVQVTYRVADESASHTVTLPDRFEVVFANASNWHPYTLQNGRLVPSA